ncbi:MAG: hypothetical protein HXX18_13235 [Bacteroidetes bacterium]|nr:hypothetical protein [Bacteroidota bacterium]
METENLMQDNALKTENIELTTEAISYLNEIRKWSSFFSIIGFIGIGLMVAAGIFASTLFSNLGYPYSNSNFPSVMIGIIYIVMAVIYIFPVIYLYKFSVSCKQAIKQKDNEDMATAFKNLKSHFKFMGIMMIIVLSIYVFAGFIFLISYLFTH